ncbi:hypothetical protein MBLNU457_g1056t1 [Dothideomycetes sp. NU457]
MLDTIEGKNPELVNTVQFAVHKATSNGPRLSTLALPGRRPIQTPNFLAITSRGVVPHITPDNFEKNTSINGVYLALEDSPQAVPPVYNYVKSSKNADIRDFVGLPEDNVTVLGARRIPPVVCPVASTNTALSIHTSVGFSHLPVKDFAQASNSLKPDITIGLGEIPFGAEKVSRKRTDRINDRTAKWMKEQITVLGQSQGAETRTPALFAPLLPLAVDGQSWYLDQLVESMLGHVSGLAVYDSVSLEGLPRSLAEKPLISLTEPRTPHHVLREVGLCIDLSTIPFVGQATDAGIALDFTFPPPEVTADTPQALALDMWQAAHATSITPLSESCTCYACTKHHRAYLQHLLMAKEMLGWVLLQIHNHHIVDAFFAGIRNSISNDTFEQDVEAFSRFYEAELPAKSGQGPRVRGYQFRSEGPGEAKRNPAAYRNLNDQSETLAEAQNQGPIPDGGIDGQELEEKGFGEQPE